VLPHGNSPRKPPAARTLNMRTLRAEYAVSCCNDAARAAAMAGTQIKQPRYSLESVAIFRGLSSPALERIKRLCSCRRYEPRESIVDHLDTSDEVFFLLTGSARVTVRSTDGKAVTFRELSPGGMFGEYAAIDGRPRSANVEARTSCLVVSMPADAFRELLEAEPKVTKTLLEHFVSEIRELTTRVFEFSTLAVRYRIQAEILRLAQLSACKGEVARIVPAPTHAEIASRTSTHREAVTRELNRLAKMGILEQRNRELWITDVDRLAALVHDAAGD
jgi:CRP/FNR family cyclic AMP-dependent transcriptional regulator